MAIELFTADQATTTVSSGGTTAPSGGTSEMWTVASSAMFGAAATGVSRFHVADPAASSEIIAVTNVSGTTWTVTRGAESTTPVTHSAGFTIYQVVTAGLLGSIPQSVTATDTSVVVTGGATSSPTIATGTLDVIAADHPPAANWSNNSHKITSLANGSGAQDAAAFGQIPTSASQIGGVTSVAAGDTSIVVGGTSAAPTIATGTLDVIAADHPPAANWSNNSHKITSLANGSGAQDAAAYGQTLAGGDGAPLTTLGDLLYENATPAPARLAGNTSSTKNFLTQTGNGTVSAAPAWGTIASGDVPTLNQNTSGTAAGLSTTLVVGSGGTGQTTQQAAMDALAGAQTSGDYLRGNGTHVSMSAIQAADLPAATTSTQGAVQLDGTAGDIQPTGTAAAAGSAGKAADASHVHVQNFGGIFGDGSDGSVTFDGTTTILGMAPSSSTYTMNRDIYCTSVTINNGVTVKTGVASGMYRIFCQGTVTNNGTISNLGGAGAANGNAASAFGLGSAGGAGGTTTGTIGNNNVGNSSGAGASGAGGTGTSGNTGGAAVAATATTPWPWRQPYGPLVMNFQGKQPAGGSGGGGGGGDNTNKGGGGGSGGGLIEIFAWAVNNGSGTITAQGGNGGTPVTGQAGGGGAGGGGLILIYTLSAWTAGATNVTAGTPGSGVGGGTSGSSGGSGTLLNVIVQ